MHTVPEFPITETDSSDQADFKRISSPTDTSWYPKKGVIYGQHYFCYPFNILLI